MLFTQRATVDGIDLSDNVGIEGADVWSGLAIVDFRAGRCSLAIMLLL